jgi:hypothetical protein
MCTIEGCDGRPVGKGLCAKHYMRLRRGGDPNVVRKAGRKPNPLNKFVADYMRSVGWSSRTLARYLRALHMLEGQPEAVRAETLQRATRSNGSVSVSKLLDMATMIHIGSEEVK